MPSQACSPSSPRDQTRHRQFQEFLMREELGSPTHSLEIAPFREFHCEAHCEYQRQERKAPEATDTTTATFFRETLILFSIFHYIGLT